MSKRSGEMQGELGKDEKDEGMNVDVGMKKCKRKKRGKGEVYTKKN